MTSLDCVRTDVEPFTSDPDLDLINQYYSAEQLLTPPFDNAWDPAHAALCRGSTARIVILDEVTILKSSLVQLCDRTDAANLHLFQSLDTERSIYERLGRHPRICTHLRNVRYGIVLERQTSCVTLELRSLPPSHLPDQSRVLRWSTQLAEALAYIHSKGVVHFDISCNNLLLTEEDDLQLCDFGGSSIDGGYHTGWYDTRYEKQDESEPMLRAPSTEWIKWELFALGSAIYEMSSGRKPYHDLPDKEVERRFKQRQFPEVSMFRLGVVVNKCWHGSYARAEEAVEDLQKLMPPHTET